MACTSTRQWPAVRVAQRWRFQATPDSVVKQGAEGKGMAEVLPNARISDLGRQLMGSGYQVSLRRTSVLADSLAVSTQGGGSSRHL
jgi:cytochrome c biogenesis protein